MRRIIALFVAILSVANTMRAQPAAVEEPVLRVSTAWSETGVKAGGQITLAIILDIKQGYHIGANTVKPPFIPTSIEVVDGPGFVVSSTPVFPEPQPFE